MTLAEYVAEFLVNNGINEVFAIQGGGCARLFDAIGRNENIRYICNQHEQATAMSADGYARVSGKIACAISTSGPGATNMITGICGSYFDSVPILFITGQVSSFRLKGNMNVRCLHTQETDIVSMVDKVTKYAVQLNNILDIRYELEKCIYLARSGRPGPTLIDIPDDYQRTEINIEDLHSFYDSAEYMSIGEKEINRLNANEEQYSKLLLMLDEVKKPIIIAGAGVRIAKAEKPFLTFVEKFNIPVVVTWGGNDLLPDNHKLKVGTMGMNGSKRGNQAVRESDCIIMLGARMDQHTIIVPLKDFARDAKKVYVDIDNNEAEKFSLYGNDIDLFFHEDLFQFINKICDCKKQYDFNDWIHFLRQDDNTSHMKSNDSNPINRCVNPYTFFECLSGYLPNDAIIFADTGSSLVWAEQSIRIKEGQRLISSLNNTPMGYALPASIGAAIALNGRVYSINGDGGLQMNIQELATVVRHNLDIKVILFDNAGYGMIQRTQDTYLKSRYEGTDVSSGLAFPDFYNVFVSYGFDTVIIDNNESILDALRDVFSRTGPGCIVVKVSIDEGFETFSKDDISNNREK